MDTTKIEGYETMTPEQKIAALEQYEPPKETKPATDELERLKAALTKANSEAAEYKRQLRAKQSDDEARQASEQEEKERILQQLEEFRKKDAISGHKSAYMALGYDEQTAAENAKALFDGDFKTVFTNHKKHIEQIKKEAEAAFISRQPGLTAGNTVTAKDMEKAKDDELRRYFGL